MDNFKEVLAQFELCVMPTSKRGKVAIVHSVNESKDYNSLYASEKIFEGTLKECHLWAQGLSAANRSYFPSLQLENNNEKQMRAFVFHTQKVWNQHMYIVNEYVDNVLVYESKTWSHFNDSMFWTTARYQGASDWLAKRFQGAVDWRLSYTIKQFSKNEITSPFSDVVQDFIPVLQGHWWADNDGGYFSIEPLQYFHCTCCQELQYSLDRQRRLATK